MGDVVKFDNYVLDRRLAVGGMAEIYLGHLDGPEGFQKRVVVKRMLPTGTAQPENVEMFLDEARLAARFRHPNLIHVYQLVEVAGQYGLVMEYIEGVDLAELVSRCRERQCSIPLEIAGHIIAEAALGLHHAHQTRGDSGEPLGVVHRDVSPSNIIATWDGTIKVVDFGIAKHRDRSDETQSGVIKGKYCYMSPEQIEERPLDRRSDIFTLGAVFYELLTLARCFARETPLDSLMAIRAGDYRPVNLHRDDLPAEVETLLARMMAHDANDRFADGAAVGRHLRQLLARASMLPTEEDVRDFLRDLFSLRERTKVVRVLPMGDDEVVAVAEDLADVGTSISAQQRQSILATGSPQDDGTAIDTEPTPPPEEPSRKSRGPKPNTDGPASARSASEQDAASVGARSPDRGTPPGAGNPLVLASTTPAAGAYGSPAAATTALGRADPTEVGAAPHLRPTEVAHARPSRTGWRPSPALALALVLIPLMALAIGFVVLSPATHEQKTPELISRDPALSPRDPSAHLTLPESAGHETKTSPTEDRSVDSPPPWVSEKKGVSSRRPKRTRAHSPSPPSDDLPPEKIPRAEDPEPVLRPPPALPKAPAPAPPGWLSLTAMPPLDVYREGRKLGRTPLKNLRLPPGQHLLQVRNDALGIKRSISVSLEAGQRLLKNMDTGQGTVSIKTDSWADVYVRGKGLGRTPLLPLPLYEGTHVIEFKNPDFDKTLRIRAPVKKERKTLCRVYFDTPHMTSRCDLK